MTTGDLKMEVDSAVATEKRKHEEEMREMERKLKMQVEQLGGALKKKSRKMVQIQRRADLQVAGEKMERPRRVRMPTTH